MMPTNARLGSVARFQHGVAAVIFLFTLFGCAYGRLVPLAPGQDDIETFVEKKSEALDASYSGIREKPGALMFEVKADGIQLTGSGWQPLKSKKDVLEIVRNMQATYRKYRGEVGVRGPRLYSILDEKDQLIGYIYSPLDVIAVRPDGKNYHVDAITEVDVRNQVDPLTRPTSTKAKSAK